MRVALLAMPAVVAFLVAPSTDAREGQPCIPKATEALPHISGLLIKQTRMRPVSAAIMSTWKGQSRPIIVSTSLRPARKKPIRSCASLRVAPHSCSGR
jgi:hypothetical protein